MATKDPYKLKIETPEEIDDIELPIVSQWEDLINRPVSLSDLDQDAQDDIDSHDATFLTLGDLAYLSSITVTEITDSAVTTPKLFAGAVTSAKISVGQLDAISADFGDMTAGTITGVTITGGTIRTASSGSRVQMSGANNRLEVYSGTVLRISIEDDTITFRNSVGTKVGDIYSTTTNLFITADNNMQVSSTAVLYLEGQGASITLSTASISMSEDIELNNNDINDCGNIRANDTTSDIGTSTTWFDNLRIESIQMKGGFLDLSQLTGTEASARTDDVDGSMYYRTDDDVIRVKLNGVWKTITTS